MLCYIILYIIYIHTYTHTIIYRCSYADLFMYVDSSINPKPRSLNHECYALNTNTHHQETLGSGYAFLLL